MPVKKLECVPMTQNLLKKSSFLEIKEKEYQGEQEIGYKYRLTSTPLSLCNYVQQGIIDNNIKQDDRANHELAILRERYKKLVPKCSFTMNAFH